MNDLISLYRNLDVVKPSWPTSKKLYYCYLSLRSFFQQRIDTFRFLTTGSFPYKVKINDQKILDRAYKKSGVVFLTIHSSSYPLLGKVFKKHFPQRKIAAPFYHKNKISVFPFFKRYFAPLGITIIALGGAMKEIDPILSTGGSVALFLDAQLPVNHTQTVTLFNKKTNLSTGPLWLAKKYHLPIIPLCVHKNKNTLQVKVFPPIKYQRRPPKTVMADIAYHLEKMILLNLDQWQVFDRFLLPLSRRAPQTLLTKNRICGFLSRT